MSCPIHKFEVLPSRQTFVSAAHNGPHSYLFLQPSIFKEHAQKKFQRRTEILDTVPTRVKGREKLVGRALTGTSGHSRAC